MGWNRHRTRRWLESLGVVRVWETHPRKVRLVAKSALREVFPDLWADYLATLEDDA